MTVEDLKIIHSHLDPNNPCDAAIFTCMVTVFYCIARLGKFTVKAIKIMPPNISPDRASHFCRIQTIYRFSNSHYLPPNVNLKKGKLSSVPFSTIASQT